MYQIPIPERLLLTRRAELAGKSRIVRRCLHLWVQDGCPALPQDDLRGHFHGVHVDAAGAKHLHAAADQWRCAPVRVLRRVVAAYTDHVVREETLGAPADGRVLVRVDLPEGSEATPEQLERGLRALRDKLATTAGVWVFASALPPGPTMSVLWELDADLAPMYRGLLTSAQVTALALEVGA